MAPAEVLARAASGSANVFETQAPDEKGIFTGLEESKAEGAPRKLLRKGYRTLTWRATDRDGDTLVYEIRVRPAGSDRWILLRKDLKETFYAFDTTALPDGDYVFRLIASDADANPDDPKTGDARFFSRADRQLRPRPSGCSRLGRQRCGSRRRTRRRRFWRPSTASTRRNGCASSRRTASPIPRRRPTPIRLDGAPHGAYVLRPGDRRGAQRGRGELHAP